MHTTSDQRYIRFQSIQVLRALAALMVAVSHLYGFDQRLYGDPVLPEVALLGNSGVDLFFIISGFAMVCATRYANGNINDIINFLLARLARVYPLWWIVLSILAAFWVIKPLWVFGSILEPPNLLLDFVLWPHERPPLLAVGWSLIHEVYFYIVFALFFIAGTRTILKLLIWGACVTGFYILMAYGVIPGSPILRLISHPLTLEFALGVLIGFFVKSKIQPNYSLLVSMGTCWMLLGSAFLIEKPSMLFDNIWLRVFVFGIGWSCIVWGLVGLEADRRFVPLRFLRKLGDASYSFYLLHVPIFGVVARTVNSFSTPYMWDNVVAWIMSLAAAVVVALLCHRFVEVPILIRASVVRKVWIS